MTHHFPEGTDHCIHCLTHRVGVAAGHVMCLGPQGGVEAEPPRRMRAADDTDVISARLAQLRAEADAALNRTEDAQ